MNETLKIVEWIMYILAAFGAGAALYGIYSVARAFYRKQDLLYRQKRDEFLQQKARVEKHLKDSSPV